MTKSQNIFRGNLDYLSGEKKKKKIKTPKQTPTFLLEKVYI